MMDAFRPSERCANLRSPIRDLVAAGRKMEKNGREVFWFNIGDPNKFDFDTPENLKNALIHVAASKTGYYSDSGGDIELIEAITNKERRINGVDIFPEDIIVTNGISEGISLMLNALIDPGKAEVLMPGPSYPVYPQVTAFSGGKPVTYKLDEENGWQTDIEDLRNRITKRTKLICVINPNNPTGSVLSEKTLRSIVNVAGEFGLPVASDEIYDRLIFGETAFKSTAAIAKDVPVIGLNGFSKSYLVPGWRCGYAYFHDPEGRLAGIKESMIAQARQRLSASTPIMKACAKAFDDDSHIPGLVRKLKERAEFAYKRLNGIDGITAVKPEGAFYIFPKVDLGKRWKTDEAFSRNVLEQTGIALPHGSGFDPAFGNGHFRSVILPPVETMERAFSLLEGFMHNS